MIAIDLKIWESLPEALKVRRLYNAYNYLKPIIRDQLRDLKRIKDEKNEVKEVGHVYVFDTVENFWENVEVAFLMGRRKTIRDFSFYAVRSCMETRLRFGYFCKQNQSDKDVIATKELLRVYHDLYKREKMDGLSGEEQIEAYKVLAKGLNIPSIEKVKRCELDPFPDIYNLCLKEYPKNYAIEYFIYSSFLCESTHGKTIAIRMRKQGRILDSARRSLMMLLPLCVDMLILVDNNFLKSKFKKGTLSCNEEIKQTVRKKLSFFEKIYIFLTQKLIIFREIKNVGRRNIKNNGGLRFR